MPDLSPRADRARTTDATGRLADSLAFLRSWLRNPRRVGAIAPSSPALARLICSEIEPRHAPVIELGPGTGVFTDALLARGLTPAQLTLIEAAPCFAGRLRQRYRQVRVLQLDATQLATRILFPDARAGAAVSGLPLRAMTPVAVEAITTGIFRWLAPGACLYQFTYGLRCPIPEPVLRRHGLKAQAIGRVWGNLPPATVYRIARGAPSGVINSGRDRDPATG